MAHEVLKDKRIDDDPHVTLKLDTTTGIAWIEDRHHGVGVSVHANISSSGSIRGMKKKGWWGQNDRTANSHGFIFNLDTFICNQNDLLEVVVADHCQCKGCRERRASRQNA